MLEAEIRNGKPSHKIRLRNVGHAPTVHQIARWKAIEEGEIERMEHCSVLLPAAPLTTAVRA